MKIDLNQSFREIEHAGTLLAQLETEGRKSTPIFFRVLDKQDSSESLGVAKWNELTFFQKVKFFFGAGEFSLRTVERLALATLRVKANKRKFSHLKKEQKESVERIIQYLWDKIAIHNTPRMSVARLFRDRKPIDASPLEKLMKNLKVKAAAKPVTPRSSQVGRSVAADLARGIENPGCLCYCNSVIQLIHSSPSLRKQIWHDEKKETDALCASLEALNAELQKEEPNLNDHALDDHRARVWDACPSLRNKLEEEKIPLLREDVPETLLTLRNQQVVRTSLLAVLAELDKSGAALSHEAEPMKSFIQAMEGLWPEVGETSKQQDASEFFLHLLEALLPPEKREGRDFYVRKVRAGKEESACLREALLHKRVEPTLENLVAAATIRSAEDTDDEATPMLVLHPNDKGEDQALGEVFADVKRQDLYLENFATKEQNPWLTKTHLKILQKAADKKGKLPPIMVSETHEIKGTPPTFLPINIARFRDQGDGSYTKNKHPVKVPLHLDVPVKGTLQQASYTLKGITVHHGGSLNGGHYVTYVPDIYPTSWMELSDSRVKKVSWASIRALVERNATLLIYDKD